MYVDDGAIYATGATINSALERGIARLTECTDWLRRNGLEIDPKKTELMMFTPNKASRNWVGYPTSLLTINHPTAAGLITVKPKQVIRYLGIYIQQDLKWTHYVHKMEMRARSTI